MAKWCNPNMLDAALDYVGLNCDKMVFCSQQPTTYTEANSTYKLASVDISSSDFTKSGDSNNGRKSTVASKTGISPSANGTANHIAFIKTGDNTLRYVTTCTAQTLAIGNSFNSAALVIDFYGPQ
jgi:hypothetical protein